MTILVVGSEGFIGSNLVRSFLKNGYRVLGCDILNLSAHENIRYIPNTKLPGFWRALFDEYHPDVCINASGSGSVAYSIAHPVNDFEANCLDVIGLLDALRFASPACKYVHLSSAAVYGNPVRLPVEENDALKPLSPYGWHKLLSENICKEYSELYGSKIAVIRPFSVYGNGLKKQLLWDVCEKLHLDDDISLFGTGKESRDFLHVYDLAKLITTIIENSGFNCDVYNAASGCEVSIGEIAQTMTKSFGDKKNISFSGQVKPGDPINWRADISKVAAMGFKPDTELGNGIAAYIKWYREAKLGE